MTRSCKTETEWQHNDTIPYTRASADLLSSWGRGVEGDGGRVKQFPDQETSWTKKMNQPQVNLAVSGRKGRAADDADTKLYTIVQGHSGFS